MAFELFTPTLANNRELSRVKRRGFVNFVIYEVALPLQDHQAVEDWLAAREELWYKNPDQRIIAVREIASGKAVAYTRWSIPSPNNPETTARIPPPAGSKAEIIAAFHERWKVMEQQYVDKSEDWTLVTVVTDPDYERKGCAGMMLRHILERADEAGVRVNVGSSRIGMPFYAKFGFKDVDELLMDFSDHGGEKDALVNKLMIREPTSTNTIAPNAVQ